ncbi:MAG TPA: cupin domain-containing protein [Longimicrobium sp.]
MGQSFSFDLAGQKAPVNVPGGTIREANADTFPALKGLSAYILTLEPGGVRIPHWHPDAVEMQYLVSGSNVQVGLMPPNDGPVAGQEVSYTLQAPGWVGFIPQGWHHYIQNNGSEPAVLMIFFNNESPDDVDVSWALAIGGRDGTRVMEQVFGISLKGANHKRIWNVPGTPGGVTPPPQSIFGFDLGGQAPIVDVPGGGTARLAIDMTFKKLEGISLFLLTLEPGASLVPHWHPDAAELDYVLSGEVFVGLMTTAHKTRAGKDMSFALKEGMVGFLPQGWFHYIQNTGTTPAQILVVFNNASPSEIDISVAFGTSGAAGQAILEEVFGISWANADFTQVAISPPRSPKP